MPKVKLFDKDDGPPVGIAAEDIKKGDRVVLNACDNYVSGGKPETPLSLELVHFGREIYLAVVDENGHGKYGGYLLTIDKETGKFKKAKSVGGDFGLELDHNNSVLIH